MQGVLLAAGALTAMVADRQRPGASWACAGKGEEAVARAVRGDQPLRAVRVSLSSQTDGLTPRNSTQQRVISFSRNHETFSKLRVAS